MTEVGTQGIAGVSTTQIEAHRLTGVHATVQPAALSGTYTGNGTTNRAIAHGLGRIPKAVLIQTSNAGYTEGMIQSGSLRAIFAGLDYMQTVTAADSTNFYIGGGSGGLNDANGLYIWTAI